MLVNQRNIVENEFLENSIKIAVTDNNFESLKKISDSKLESEEIELSPINSEIDSDDEYNNLVIQKGNLTVDERNQINQHAKHSKDILDNINWGKTLSNVPKLASSHHEKLNGKGYPFGLDESRLSLIERIMPIIDIYDALTATDRPYKPAMSKEKACEILGYEVKNGSLDKQLVSLFIDKVVKLGSEENEH